MSGHSSQQPQSVEQVGNVLAGLVKEVKGLSDSLKQHSTEVNARISDLKSQWNEEWKTLYANLGEREVEFRTLQENVEGLCGERAKVRADTSTGGARLSGTVEQGCVGEVDPTRVVGTEVPIDDSGNLDQGQLGITGRESVAPSATAESAIRGMGANGLVFLPFHADGKFRDLRRLPSDLQCYDNWADAYGIQHHVIRHNQVSIHFPAALRAAITELEVREAENWNDVKVIYYERVAGMLGTTSLNSQLHKAEDKDSLPHTHYSKLRDLSTLLCPRDEKRARDMARAQFARSYRGAVERTVQQKLYDSPDLSDIKLVEFVVRSLAKENARNGFKAKTQKYEQVKKVIGAVHGTTRYTTKGR